MCRLGVKVCPPLHHFSLTLAPSPAAVQAPESPVRVTKCLSQHTYLTLQIPLRTNLYHYNPICKCFFELHQNTLLKWSNVTQICFKLYFSLTLNLCQNDCPIQMARCTNGRPKARCTQGVFRCLTHLAVRLGLMCESEVRGVQDGYMKERSSSQKHLPSRLISLC